MYRDNKSIVIGRHQNPWKECAIQQMREDNIAFCRRKSGGGAVYHDLGNSCYSFLTPIAPDVLPLNARVDNNKVLVRALESIGIHTELSDRNDIFYNGKKVSGSAYQASLGKKDGSGRKTLHHGTMLLDADLNSLRKYLNPKKEFLVSKGVDSVKSPVGNLIDARGDLTHDKFCEAVIEEYKKSYPGSEYKIEEYIQEDMENIPRVAEIQKELISWDWQFRKTPEFSNKLIQAFQWGTIEISMKVVHGSIVEGKATVSHGHEELVKRLDEALNSKEIIYDQYGCLQLCQHLTETLESTTANGEIVYDLEQWLPMAI